MTEYFIDWSKAPEGCNMAFIADYKNWENGELYHKFHWEKVDLDGVYEWRDDEWVYWDSVNEINLNNRVKRPTEDTFIEWKGGEQPVPTGTMVHVRYLDGEEAICTAGIQYWSANFKRLLGSGAAVSWRGLGSPASIVAYKLYKEPSTQGEVPVSPEVESVSTEAVESHKYNIGDEVRIVSEKHGHCYEIGKIVTLTGFTSVEDNSQYGEDYWHTGGDCGCWDIVESEFEPYEEQNVKPLELVYFGAIADEPITTAVGATLDADIVINIGHQNYLVSVKQARKLYKDLKSIFKEQLR